MIKISLIIGLFVAASVGLISFVYLTVSAKPLPDDHPFYKRLKGKR